MKSAEERWEQRRMENHDNVGYETDMLDFSEYGDGYGNNVCYGDTSMQTLVERGIRHPGTPLAHGRSLPDRANHEGPTRIDGQSRYDEKFIFAAAPAAAAAAGAAGAGAAGAGAAGAAGAGAAGAGAAGAGAAGAGAAGAAGAAGGAGTAGASATAGAAAPSVPSAGSTEATAAGEGQGKQMMEEMAKSAASGGGGGGGAVDDSQASNVGIYSSQSKDPRFK